MKKYVFLAIFFNFAIILGVNAQSADMITEILNTEEISYSQAAYLASSFWGFTGDESNIQEAVNAMSIRNLSDIPANPNNPIRYDKFAQLCMNTWIKKGGLFYTITKNPRYSFKELKALGIIDYNISPDNYVTGRDALNIITRCSDLYEERNEND